MVNRDKRDYCSRFWWRLRNFRRKVKCGTAHRAVVAINVYPVGSIGWWVGKCKLGLPCAATVGYPGRKVFLPGANILLIALDNPISPRTVGPRNVLVIRYGVNSYCQAPYYSIPFHVLFRLIGTQGMRQKRTKSENNEDYTPLCLKRKSHDGAPR